MEQLIRKRGSVKAKLSIFEKYVKKLETLYPDYTVTDQNEFLEVEQRYERFSNVIDQFEDLQGQIEQLSDDPEAQYLERELFEEVFFGVVARSKRFLISNGSASPARSSGSQFQVGGSQQSAAGSHISGVGVGGSHVVSSNRPASVTGQNANISLPVNNPSGVKLPVIEIKIFDGEFSQWLEFRDTYDSLIHTNSSLSGIQKFHYLRSYLGPTVLETIASLEICDSNYDNAWALICDRFNNSRILIQNHIKAIFLIDKISTESSGALRKMVDSVAKHLRALKTLNEPTEAWDNLIIYLITTKLDDVTLRKWEQLKASYKTPTLHNLNVFLKERADLLESLGHSKSQSNGSQPYKQKRVRTLLAEHHGSARGSSNPSKPQCTFCGKEHYISTCADFLKLNLNERIEQFKRKRLCLNCLRAGHSYRQCFSGTCKRCNSKHHTLLHFDDKNPSDTPNDRELRQERVSLSSRNEIIGQQVLLSTVLITVFDSKNKPRTARALLDAGSQASFLTEHFSSKLNLSKLSIDIRVIGINETQSECKGKCVVRVKSKVNQFSTNISCLIVPQITGKLPNFQVDTHSLKFPENIKLADPYFDSPADIDMLIGADLFWDIISVGQIKLATNGPYLQKTKFGWVVSGAIQSTSTHVVHCNFGSADNIDRQLSRFWEIEEFSGVKPMSLEEKACEKHFIETFTRDSYGRFVVTIPMLEDPEKLGDSYDTAKKRFCPRT